MKIKQHISKQQIGYCRNKKRNQNISRTKWQWKHDNSKPMGYSKSSSKREVYSNTILPQETEKHWIDNLTLYIKQLEKKNKRTPELIERKKS